jgi:GDP-4-dehydro-6-deoxy-D-mannose reductase
MKVLVTGAGGFVGRYLVETLISHQHQVSALGIGNSEYLKASGVTIYEADITDFSAVLNSLQKEKPDAVIHLAAVSNVPLSWQKPGLTIDVNIRGTVNVLQALAQVNTSATFLSIGSSDEYGLAAKAGIPLEEEMLCQPQNPYSISKYCAEQLVLQLGKKYGVNVIHTRSFNHFGPGQAKGFVLSDFASQIADIEKGKKPPILRVGDLSVSRDFTFVEDVVDAYAALIEKQAPSGVYNVCSGKARNVGAILQLLLSFSSASIKVEKDPAKYRISEVPYFIGNSEKLFKATGWEPVCDFEDSLKSVLDYWRKL